MLDTIHAFRQRHGLSQTAIAEHFGFKQGWVSPRDNIPVEKLERWVYGFLQWLDGDLKRERSRLPKDSPPCPECGGPMKPRNWYLKDWFHGELKACCFCKGSPDKPHPRVSMGLLVSSGLWQRLDRVTNPRTGQETPLRRKRKKLTDYEREHGLQWCDSKSGRDSGCGGLLTPCGNHRFQGAADAVYKIFRCFNPGCAFGKARGGDRLYCKDGKCFEAGSIPSARRRSSLPEGTRCFYCRGQVHSRGNRGAPPDCTQLHCINIKCGKISYLESVSGRVLPSRKPGGNLSADPHRSKCRKCARRGKVVPRCGFTKAQLEKRPTLVPIPVRLRLQKRATLRAMLREAKSNDEVLIVYRCPHRQTYKTHDGKVVWIRNAKYRMVRGRSFAYSLAHREGRPVKPRVKPAS